MRIKRTGLHTFTVVFGVTVIGALLHATIGSQNSDTDAQFEQSFVSLYGYSSDDFYGLGEDGFVGRWLNDAEVESRDCITYDTCNFVELATVTSCSFGFSLEFDLLDDNENVVGHAQTDSSPLHAGELKVIEIGANEDKPFAFLAPQEVRCLEDGAGV